MFLRTIYRLCAYLHILGPFCIFSMQLMQTLRNTQTSTQITSKGAPKHCKISESLELKLQSRTPGTFVAYRKPGKTLRGYRDKVVTNYQGS